jgi:6-phosphogluconolactonase
MAGTETQPDGPQVRVCNDVAALIEEAAKRVIAASKQAIAERSRFAVALAGGSTPKPLYELLATIPCREQVEWFRTHIFWGDERLVPPDDPRSNFRMAREALLDHVPIPAGNVHRVCTESGNPEQVAAAYEATIRQVLDSTGNTVPALDVCLLGLGENGHTASLFPGSPVLHESSRLVASEYVAEVAMWRVTMTFLLINQSRLIMFLVAGAGKAPVLRKVLAADPKTLLPAQLVKPVDGTLLWLVDRAAMGEESAGSR